MIFMKQLTPFLRKGKGGRESNAEKGNDLKLALFKMLFRENSIEEIASKWRGGIRSPRLSGRVIWHYPY